MSCPEWKDCVMFKCHDERLCLNGTYWAEYHKAKAAQKGKVVPAPPAIIDAPAGVCWYCERQLGKTGYRFLTKTRDHIIPSGKGGINHPLNYVDACERCNKLKADMMPEDFANHLGYLLNSTVHTHIAKDTLITMLYNTRALIKKIERYRHQLFYVGPREADFKLITIKEFKATPVIPEPEVKPKIYPPTLKGVDKEGTDWYNNFIKQHYHNPPINFHSE